MFSNKEIADYYNQTIDHYNIWWKLKQSLSVHYGYWDEHTKNFTQALQNLNKQMALLANIKPTDIVLDAGCGVGGSAFYLAEKKGCYVEGITLSEKQLTLANDINNKFEQKHLVNFSLQDFTKTNFKSESFDIIWACESSCYASPKINFINEVKRLLKPNGKLIVADYFTTGKTDEKKYLRNWANLWAIDEFHSPENFTNELMKNDFEILHDIDVSNHILKSSKRMYYSTFIGAIPSEIYNLLHNTSHFGKKHYQSGYFQYKALVNSLWTYRLLVAKKMPTE